MTINDVLILAQSATAPAEAGPRPWWQVLVEGSFGLTVLFIFLAAIVAVLVGQLKKDKCLKLVHDYHISYLSTTGKAIWGNLIVCSKGLEVVFDAPYLTRRGIYKSSALLYEADLVNCLAICRSVDALTEQEKRNRDRQIRSRFRPGFVRRMGRSLRNMLNTLRDAFSKALSALIGQLSRTPSGAILTTQKAGVEQIGQTLLGAAANAYEPLLERHIGRPVVVQLASPADPQKRVIDLPGFLVDYTEKYLAVFNVAQAPVSHEQLEISQSHVGSGYTIELTEQSVKVTCTGPDVVIVKSIKTAKRYSELDVVLTNGTQVDLNRDGSETVAIHLQRTRGIDIVCPRSQANVYFGGDEADLLHGKVHGLAPEPEVQRVSDPSTKLEG
jgi:hypothetical protein